MCCMYECVSFVVVLHLSSLWLEFEVFIDVACCLSCVFGLRLRFRFMFWIYSYVLIWITCVLCLSSPVSLLPTCFCPFHRWCFCVQVLNKVNILEYKLLHPFLFLRSGVHTSANRDTMGNLLLLYFWIFPIGEYEMKTVRSSGIFYNMILKNAVSYLRCCLWSSILVVFHDLSTFITFFLNCI